MRKLLIILGIPIDDLDMASALTRIDDFIRVGRQTGRSHQIATVNADFVVKARQDPELRQILQECDMATADGMPLVWGAKLLGMPLNGRVTGADLVPALAERAAQEGYSLFLLGAAPGVAARAADILTTQNPGLHIAGVLSPPKSSIFEMSPEITAAIRAARPDILLVAFGNPKQEKWIAMHAPELQVPVSMGIGGTLDFIAGATRRAPEWMQRSGLEWIYRMAQEPRRLWRRYVSDMVGFVPFFVRQWWLMRQGKRPSTILPHSNLVVLPEAAVLTVNGRLDRSNTEPFHNQATAALLTADHIIVDLAQATFIDSTGLGALVNLHKRAQAIGKRLSLTAVPEPVAKAITLLRLDRLFTIYATLDDALLLQPTTPPTYPQGKWQVFSMPSRLDAHNANEMAEKVQTLLHTNPNLILNLAETTFLASAGMAMMAKMARLAVGDGGEVRLVGCQPDVAQSLKLANFDKVLPIYSEMAAAVG